MIEKFFLMLIGHAVADYALQNDFVAKFKSHKTGSEMWPYVLACHGLIHGGFVFLITGSPELALAESVLHAGIDFLKCDGRINFHADQWLHVGCKALWAIV